MGASKYKQNRSDERSKGVVSAKETAALEAQKKAQKTKTLGILGTILLVIAIVFTIVVNSGVLDKKAAAVKIGDTSYTAAEVRYAKQTCYNNFYNNYNSLISYFIDTSKPLDEQECSFEEGITWDEYFLRDGMNYLKEMTALYNAAKAEGITLTEEDADTIQQNIDMMAAYASAYGYSTDGYIAACYGEGNNEKSVRSMMERSLIASRYAADRQKALSESYTDAELETYYDENRFDFESVTYLTAMAYYETDEETGEVVEDSKAVAKASAERIMGLADGDSEKFRTVVLEELDTEPTDSGNTLSYLEDPDWFADPARKVGDLHMVEESSGVRVYCWTGIDHNDYNTVNVRHILIQSVDEDGDGDWSDAENSAAREKLEAIREQWDGTEEQFIELCRENSEDSGSVANGGLYEDVYRGQMVTEFNDWIFGERKAGDSEIVFGSNGSYAGYHLIYFVGEGDSYAHVLARNAKFSEDFEAWETAAIEAVGEPVECFMYKFI